MFSDRRRLRRWAAQVLLVWLFGLAMGVANACALGDSPHHADAVHAPTRISAHHHGDEGGEQSKTNCLDFCEKSSVGAPQLKLVGDNCAVLAFALPVSGALSVVALPEPAIGRLGVDSPHSHGGPPLRIALQRLAL